MEKIDDFLSEGCGSLKVSNELPNPRDTMFYNMMNDCRDTAIDISVDVAKDTYSKINKAISNALRWLRMLNTSQDLHRSDIKEIKVYVTNVLTTVVNNIKKVIKAYYPSVQVKSIELYILKNNNAEGDIKEQLENCSKLMGCIKEIIRGLERSQDNYITIKARIQDAKKHNDYLKKEIAQNNFVDLNDMIDISKLYKRDYLDRYLKSGTRILMEKLLPYSIAN